MKKIVIATNLYQIDPVIHSSHMAMFHHLGKNNDKYQTIFFGPWRVPIDRARNDAAHMALYHEADYLVFFDDDMYFADATWPLKLIETMEKSDDKIHIMQALAYIRGYPFQPMIFKTKEFEGRKRMVAYDDFEDHIREDGLVEVDAVGCCATVIDARLFKDIPSPWFVTGENNTEDIYFCVKAKDYMQGVGIFCDTKIEIGHLLERPVLTHSNVKALRKFYEENMVNQLLLPDPEFVPTIQAIKNNYQIFEERANPLEFQEQLSYRKEAENA